MGSRKHRLDARMLESRKAGRPMTEDPSAALPSIPPCGPQGRGQGKQMTEGRREKGEGARKAGKVRKAGKADN